MTGPLIASPELDRWLAQRTGAVPPLTLTHISGGYSNLTYAVTDQRGARWVLRHPPAGRLGATAHDVGREATVLAALAVTAVPVPAVVGACSDSDVLGVPFFVMDFVDGLVVRSPADAERLDPSARAEAGSALIAALTAIHVVDIDAVGLGELGRRNDYVRRQLWRFGQQLGQFDEDLGSGLVPLLRHLHASLADDVPPQPAATLVHGDFRIDNSILDPSGAVLAVLDWELTTLGDPLADVALFSLYWREAGEDDFGLAVPTTVDGFPTRAELLDRYAAQTGRDLSRLPYYEALGQWKLACINVGVAARAAGGQLAQSSAAILDSARRRAEHAHSLLAAGRPR